MSLDLVLPNADLKHCRDLSFLRHVPDECFKIDATLLEFCII